MLEVEDETLVLTRKQAHDLRASVGTIMMAADMVRPHVKDDQKLFFNMIDKHVKVCLDILK